MQWDETHDAHEAGGPCADAARRARSVAWTALDLLLLEDDDLYSLERTVVVDAVQLATIRGRLGALGATYTAGEDRLVFTDPVGTTVTVVTREAASPARLT
ncbi:hypothetical protein [Nocardioides bigeumensis]|uniref:Glyoxalase-like domain-containing protein n=1 Tax=Nocardioides bigeumensis TaxID=433657 RepID=A0ABP5KIF7_9ACTN